MKRISIVILTLFLLITSFPIPTSYAVQKGDDKGVVLNLPPFVDFEVKEKRKVDIMVDVGNTSHTLDEMNSIINEIMRPALAAEGLDYQIHVEKSSEGKTKQYFAVTPYEDNSEYGFIDFAYSGPIWSHDILTGENILVSEKAGDGGSAMTSITRILEDEKTLVYSEGNGGIRMTEWADFDSNKVKSGAIRAVKNGACPTTGYADPAMLMPVFNIDGYSYGGTWGDVTITPDGRIIGLSTTNRENRNGWLNCNLPATQFFSMEINDVKTVLNTREWSDSIQTGFNRPWSFPHPIEVPKFQSFPYLWDRSLAQLYYATPADNVSVRFHVTNDGALYKVKDDGWRSFGSIYYYNDLDEYIQSEGTIAPNFTGTKNYAEREDYFTQNRERYLTKAPYKLNPVTGDLIFREVVSGSRYTLSKFDKSQGKVIRGVINREVVRGSAVTVIYWVIAGDGSVVIPATKDQVAGVNVYEDVLEEPNFISMQNYPFTNNRMVTALGDYVFFTGTTNEAYMYKMNIHTGEYDVAIPRIEFNTLYGAGKGDRKLHIYTIPYPDYVSTTKRYMTDILNEKSMRADAEKFYIRIDDNQLLQLRNPKEIANLASEMLAQQITYIPLGTNKNKSLHEQLLTTMNNNGKFISKEHVESAMGQALSMITNKKEADIHVLVANETIALNSIKNALKDMQTELKNENIMSNIHYVQGTSTSTVFQLLNQIQWSEEHNNYVVMFNRGSMSELNDMDYEVEVADVLNVNYANYISIGSTANATLNQSLIDTIKGDGIKTTSTAIQTVKKVITDHVIATAVKNPKRVTDTLVLNYDSATGSYSSDVLINTFYEDSENDPKFNERFKTTHDPTVYENHTGVMEGIGQYQESPTTQFTKVGKYEMVVQVQDNPSTNAAFSNYRQWSLDSLSRLVLFVHRAPIADFIPSVNASRRLTITDLSYDLDRYSQRNKGIVSKVWKWKKADDEAWTSGAPPTTLAANTDYYIALKVKDIDGAWSNEVIKFVSTKDSNQPPVALFTIQPKNVSWNKSFSITDQSYDPDGDAIILREWIVKKDGNKLLTKGSTPTSTEMKQAAIQAGLNQLGTYQLSLRVQDSENMWSEWYTDHAEVVNYAPIAQFEPLRMTYRDTMNQVINLTANPDLDGDAVSYQWRLLKDEKVYSLGTARDVSFRIKDRGLGKYAIGTWLVELKASDPLGASSVITHSFEVINQIPTAEITQYPPYAYIDEPYSFQANGDDADSEDRSSLQSFWKLTTTSGKVITYYEKDLNNIQFTEKGKHVMEYWVQDQLGAESEVDRVEFNVLNKLPIADFTRNPVTTYRGIDILFKSLSTDYDGWIETYRYELLRDNMSPLTLSTDNEFTRSFSSIGTFPIRHTVTDNDGASDSITKDIYIINRKPIATVTVPSGKNSANATQFNTLTPTIEWTMQDADGDAQQRYQVQIKQSNGTVLYTSNQLTSSSKTFDIPASAGLQENITYRATVRVFDGFDWSNYAADKYFYIVLNRPPVAGFTWDPSSIWEGDQVAIKHQVSDPDMDLLQIRYNVTSPSGVISSFPSKTGYYQVAASNYNGAGPVLNHVLNGRYMIEQIVIDPKGETAVISKNLNVGELTVIGKVQHTEQWESIRLQYNDKNQSGKWTSNQFLAGEKLVLRAVTTTTKPHDLSITHAIKVEAVFVRGDTMKTLQRTNEMSNDWEGEMWEDSFENLKNGHYEIIFYATYSNDIVKQDTVTIEIVGKAESMVGVHRLK